MPPPKGHPRYGGRVKGTPNKLTAYTRAQAWAYCHAKGYNPVKALVDLGVSQQEGTPCPACGRVPSPDIGERIQVARELLKYLMVPLRAMEPDTGQIGEDVTVVLEGDDASDLAEDAEISDVARNGSEAV